MPAQVTAVAPDTPTAPAQPLGPAPAPASGSGPARRLSPERRRDLACRILAGSTPVARIAREQGVSRKFLHRQADIARDALDGAFDPAPARDDVLFYLPVTRAWLRRLILALVLTCRGPYRGVVDVLRDLFAVDLSLGTVHNTVRSAAAAARRVNASYGLAGVRVGAHDEIFQAGRPVLVGVDAASTFCYLLSLEDRRDAETWGVRLLELAEAGLAPEAVVADFGAGLRAGQELAWPGVPCRGDVFHLARELQATVTYLENRAEAARADLARLERWHDPGRGPGRPPRGAGRPLAPARAACRAAVALAEDVATIARWLRLDVLAVAGPCHADRLRLYDFLVEELAARVAACRHRLGPIHRTLSDRRDELLGFAAELDRELGARARAWGMPREALRRWLNARCRDEADPARWAEEAAMRGRFGRWYGPACRAVDALIAGTVRASSLVENVNGRLRTYFEPRRHLGPEYLELLRFYLNHRVLRRSERPERRGRTPAEMLTGRPHAHWLELLGFGPVAQAG